MPLLAPPPPPDSALARFDENLRRVQFRLWQILMTAITVAITAWFVTLGPWSAILALMVAKHVLVAILAVGLHLPPAAMDGADAVGHCESAPDPT
jgi:hypothetical protein